MIQDSTLFLTIALIILLAGCNHNRVSFYSVDRNCLVVSQDTGYVCYKTHEAFALHEGYQLGHAKQRFNAFKKQSLKRKKIAEGIKNENVKTYPTHMKEENWVRKSTIDTTSN